MRLSVISFHYRVTTRNIVSRYRADNYHKTQLQISYNSLRSFMVTQHASFILDVCACFHHTFFNSLCTLKFQLQLQFLYKITSRYNHLENTIKLQIMLHIMIPFYTRAYVSSHITRCSLQQDEPIVFLSETPKGTFLQQRRMFSLQIWSGHHPRSTTRSHVGRNKPTNAKNEYSDKHCSTIFKYRHLLKHQNQKIKVQTFCCILCIFVWNLVKG